MNNRHNPTRITTIAIEYNGNDKGTAEMYIKTSIKSEPRTTVYRRMKTVADRNKNVKNWALTGYILQKNPLETNYPMKNSHSWH
jgi:hypothetical protein